MQRSIHHAACPRQAATGCLFDMPLPVWIFRTVNQHTLHHPVLEAIELVPCLLAPHVAVAL